MDVDGARDSPSKIQHTGTSPPQNNATPPPGVMGDSGVTGIGQISMDVSSPMMATPVSYAKDHHSSTVLSPATKRPNSAMLIEPCTGEEAMSQDGGQHPPVSATHPVNLPGNDGNFRTPAQHRSQAVTHSLPGTDQAAISNNHRAETSATSLDPMSPAGTTATVDPHSTNTHSNYIVLPDCCRPNLDVLIVGINPGYHSAITRHHYAGPTNHFWKCLYLSQLITEPLTSADDHRLPSEYGIGLTNLCSRVTTSSSELTGAELRAGARRLMRRLSEWKPKIIAFNGMTAWRAFARHALRLPATFADTTASIYGRQPNFLDGTILYAMPSSSARCAHFPSAEDKVTYYYSLKQLRDTLCNTQNAAAAAQNATQIAQTAAQNAQLAAAVGLLGADVNAAALAAKLSTNSAVQGGNPVQAVRQNQGLTTKQLHEINHPRQTSSNAATAGATPKNGNNATANSRMTAQNLSASNVSVAQSSHAANNAQQAQANQQAINNVAQLQSNDISALQQLQAQATLAAATGISLPGLGQPLDVNTLVNLAVTGLQQNQAVLSQQAALLSLGLGGTNNNNGSSLQAQQTLAQLNLLSQALNNGGLNTNALDTIALATAAGNAAALLDASGQNIPLNQIINAQIQQAQQMQNLVALQSLAANCTDPVISQLVQGQLLQANSGFGGNINSLLQNFGQTGMANNQKLLGAQVQQQQLLSSLGMPTSQLLGNQAHQVQQQPQVSNPSYNLSGTAQSNQSLGVNAPRKASNNMDLTELINQNNAQQLSYQSALAVLAEQNKNNGGVSGLPVGLEGYHQLTHHYLSQQDNLTMSASPIAPNVSMHSKTMTNHQSKADQPAKPAAAQNTNTDKSKQALLKRRRHSDSAMEREKEKRVFNWIQEQEFLKYPP